MGELSIEHFSQSSRTNGWDCPWHILQAIAWLITFYFVTIFFGCLAPNLVSPWDIVSYIITGVSTLGLIITLMTATVLDPADPAVRAKGGNKEVPRLDRTKNKRVIENQTCALCQVIVSTIMLKDVAVFFKGPKSKHCSACNKCVSGFDHHCRWLNNCVGDRNYRWFFSSLIFGLLASLMVNIVGILLFVGIFTDEDEGNIVQVYKDAKSSNSSANLLMFNNKVEDTLFLTIDAITVILALLAFVLMLHLMQFHIWLMCKGLTTYDFIIREREKARAKQENAQHRHELSMSTSRSQPLKANRITPSKQQEKAFSRSEVDDEVKQYQKALAEKERMDGGETPPPLATPIYKDGKNSRKQSITDESDKNMVRKMKKKKKKKTLNSNSHEVQIATIEEQIAIVKYLKHDNMSSTTQSDYHAFHKTTDAIFDGTDDLRFRRKQASGSWKNGGTLPNHPYRAKFETPPSDDQLSPARRKISNENGALATSADELSVNGTVDELNTTTMFSVNKSASLNPDGSLNYPSQGHIRTLPLTPIPKQKWNGEEVPPLDLSALRASTESTNSFKPYSGTTRSTDTYRFPPFDQKALPPLRTLPESVAGDGHEETF